jgi:hypothetical protein
MGAAAAWVDAVMAGVTFLYPIAGWLFAALPLVWLTARPLAADPRRRIAHVALRGGVFACLILALMQPSLIRRSGGADRVILLDQRAALGEPGRAAARSAYAALIAHWGGGRQMLVQLGEAPFAAGRVDERVRVPGTSLSTALSRAAAVLPPGVGGAITVVSDGRSPDRHWDRTVAALMARGVRIDAVKLASPQTVAFIADVTAAPARAGERADVTVAVVGDGRAHSVTLSEGGRPIAISAPFRDAGPTTITMHVAVPSAGFRSFRAALSGSAAAPVDAVAAVQDPLRVLYLGGLQAGGAARLQQLVGGGFTIVPGSGIVGGAGNIARYPLVLLDDRPAAQFAEGAQRALAAAVADGGTGLLASGGEAAFGAGGYATGPLASILPVRPRQQERREEPTVALAVVIDSSGSMGGMPLDLAKQVARQTVRKLKAIDHVGVVEFYGARQWAVAMQPATQLPEVERAIGRMQAQGGTTLYPALEEAYYGLKDVPARYRHMLIISDGGVEEDRYQQLLRHIADDRITVSTVQVGGDPEGEKSMAEWARLGRGRFYQVPDEFGLVAIDFRQPQMKPDPDYRAGRYPVFPARAPTWWRGVTAPPPLTGYARVTARAEADTLLDTSGGDPVLASWQYGAGRVTALATQPVGAGTAGWRGWTGYGRWLARVLGLTARQRPDLTVTAERRFDRLHLTVRSFATAAAGVPALRMLAPDGATAVATVQPIGRAPGLFTSDIAYPADRPALIEARFGDAVARAADRASSDVSPPDAMSPGFTLPLAALARATGGRAVASAKAGPLPLPPGGGLAAIDLWPWLALAGLALYLAEIGWRRRPARARHPHPEIRR